MRPQRSIQPTDEISFFGMEYEVLDPIRWFFVSQFLLVSLSGQVIDLDDVITSAFDSIVGMASNIGLSTDFFVTCS